MNSFFHKAVKTAQQKTKQAFEIAMDLVFGIMLFFMTLTMLVGALRLFYQLKILIASEGITGNYLPIFTDVLTLFILIELSRSLYEYISLKRIRITLVIDAAIVFIIRDVMIIVFKHDAVNNALYPLSAVLLVLGVLRIGITYADNLKTKEPRNTPKNPQSL